MGFLVDVLIVLGFYLGGVLTGAHYALKANEPTGRCVCGHHAYDHLDGAGACDADEVCECYLFRRPRKVIS